MPRKEASSDSEVSEDEYEVEYVYQARWTGDSWEYEVHWYGYDTDNDTWEPEENLTNFGSADLVDRFWKQFPGQRHAKQYDKEPYKASVDWLIEERKRFLAHRPKNRVVKGVEKPPKQSRDKPILVGDSESGEDDDILHSTTDEDADDDILHSSSSSDDAPLMNRVRAKTAQAGSSTGPGTKARSIVHKQASSSLKIMKRRSSLTKSSALATSTSSAKGPYPSPVVKTTKIGREPATIPRRGRVFHREDMQAGSISKDFRGIGTKGKQAERASEILALGRRSGSSTVPVAPAARSTNSFTGMSMRKAGQAPGGSAPGPSNTTGSGHIASRTLAASPTGLAPTERPGSLDATLGQSIDAMIRGIEAAASPASPTDSLFDGSYHDEVEAPPQLDDDLNFDDFMADLPAPVQLDPPQQPKPSKPQRPTVSIGGPPAHNPWDNHTPNQLNAIHDAAPNHVMESPVFTVPPLQPGQWRWTGELYVVTQETVPTPDGGQATKNEQSRVCAVLIRDPAVNNEKDTKIFTSTLESYVKGKIDLQSTFDVNVAYSEIVAGAFEATQAGWMMCTDQEGTSEWELWKGILRKMELHLLVTVVKIYNSKNVEFARHLLLIPSPLIRKFRRAMFLNPLLEPFKSHTNGFVVLMCKKNFVDSSIPPELHDELRGVKCLIFPGRHVDPEVNILRTELIGCGAVPIDGIDQNGLADAIFVHRGWVEHLSTLLGFAHRRQKLYKRFYVFGSGGLWRVAEWDLRQVWLFGGMVTFTPAAIIEDPTIVCRVVQALEGKAFWHAYIEPKTVGILALRKDDAALGFEIVTFLEEMALSSDLVPYGLALTSPPLRGLVESYDWADKQLHRATMAGDELRVSCEEEVTRAYRAMMEEKARREEEKARKEEEAIGLKAQETAKLNGGGSGGGGEWGNGSAASNGGGGWGNGASSNGGGWGDGSTGRGASGWGTESGGWGTSSGWGDGGCTTSPPTTNPGWASPTPPPASGNPWGTTTDATTSTTDPRLKPKPKPEVDMSGFGNEVHIREMSDDVIDGLRQMQIQPCFMRELRRFVVVDSKTRVKDIKAYKLEVEVHTADTFIADLAANY